MGIVRTGEGEKKKSLIREYIEAIVVAVLLAVVIRTFVVQAFKIPSGSMIPTLLIGDHILVNKLSSPHPQSPNLHQKLLNHKIPAVYRNILSGHII